MWVIMAPLLSDQESVVRKCGKEKARQSVRLREVDNNSGGRGGVTTRAIYGAVGHQRYRGGGEGREDTPSG